MYVQKWIDAGVDIDFGRYDGARGLGEEGRLGSL